MRNSRILGRAAMAALMAMTLGVAQAQRWHHHRSYIRPYVTTRVVVRPAVTVKVSNRFSQAERFSMAMAYLANNRYLTTKTYSKITGLPRQTAEAELEAFALDKRKPIVAVVSGKKRMFAKA